MTESGRDDKPETNSMVLPEELTISQSAECFRSFMQRMEGGRIIDVDAGSVTRVDAAGIQMLFAVQRELSQVGCTLHWHAVSETLRESAELLGMSALLAIPDGV